MRFSFLIAIVLIVNLSGVPSASAYTWYTYNGHEYAFLSDWHNVGEQETLAIAQGAHLVTINDDAENTWVMNKFLDNTVVKGAFIGYYENTTEGNWTWFSGNSSYTNWTIDYPSDKLNLSSAVLYYPWGGTWYDVYQGANTSAIMERPVVPIPPSVWLLGAGLAGIVGLRRRFGRK